MGLLKKSATAKEAQGFEYYIELMVWGVAFLTALLSFFRTNPLPKKKQDNGVVSEPGGEL